jgi:hypothetical protein
MAETAPVRVRCKQGNLYVANGYISIEPGLVRWWQHRWSVPSADVAALGVSRGIGVTFSLTFHLADGRELQADWLLPHDAQQVAGALDYSLTLYDLYEMAAEHTLGVPFTYDVIALTPVVSADLAGEPTAEPQPVVQIVPASETLRSSERTVPELPPSRMQAAAERAAAVGAAVAAALWLALADAGAYIARMVGTLLATLRASRAAGRLTRATAPTMQELLPRARVISSTLASSTVSVASRGFATLRDSIPREMNRASAAAIARRSLAMAAIRAPRLLRSRNAIAALIVALVLSAAAASMTAAPHQRRALVSETGSEIGRLLPRRAVGKLSTAAVTPTPTHAPQPTPTPTPTPTPQPTPAPPPSLTLAITCAGGLSNQQARVCVHTQPGAALTITVTYCDGTKAHNKSLQGTVYANASGNYMWTWIASTRCLGPAVATVTARWHGQTVSQSAVFTLGFSPLSPADTPVPLPPGWYQ